MKPDSKSTVNMGEEVIYYKQSDNLNDEIDFADLWILLVSRKKIFIAVFIISILLGGGGMVNKFSISEFTITSIIDAGSMPIDGESISGTYLNSLVNRVKYEYIPSALRESTSTPGSNAIGGTSVKLQSQTSLIEIVNRVEQAQTEDVVGFQQGLVKQVILDLESAYSVLQFEILDQLLDVQSMKINLKEQMRSEGDDNSALIAQKISVYDKKIENFERVLKLASPKVIFVAETVSSPPPLGKILAAVLIFFLSLILAFMGVFVFVFIEHVKKSVASRV